MIYTIFPKEPNETPHDCETYKEALEYCKDKGYIVDEDCVIEQANGDIK